MICKVCGKEFSAEAGSADPAQELGRFLAKEVWGDAGELCPDCLAGRGLLGMMYESQC